jgi:hypothetical protein
MESTFGRSGSGMRQKEKCSSEIRQHSSNNPLLGPLLTGPTSLTSFLNVNPHWLQPNCLRP